MTGYSVELPPAWRNSESTDNLAMCVAEDPLLPEVDLCVVNTQPSTENRGSAVRRLRRSGQ